MTAPPVITITEQSRYGDGFHATVEVTGDPRRHEVTVRDPADDAGRELFRWYFERFQACPFFRSARREEAERALSAYGVALFTQVFADRPDHHRGADRLIVSGTAAFHRLHWEMMRDPGDDQPLSVRMPLERHTRPEAEYRPLPPGPSLNVLVVAARPFGDDDPHTISRTLVTAAGHTPRPPLRVSLSRPGTWAALHESLEGQRYQAIHLDLHGEVLDHAALRDGIGIGRLEPSSAITPYQGEQAFLFFETRADGVADPVPAAAVARLLRENRLTVAMLNACRPAGAGVAQRLAAAGVPVVVGMAYPPTTAAAARVVPDFYRRLAAGDTPREAVREVRRGLFHHPGRTTLFNRTVMLRDWMLPVLYQQQEVTVGLAGMSEAEQTAFDESLARGGPEPHEVIGRDVDVLAVERRVLHRGAPNEVVVHGPAGVGKTWLLRLLAWWWRRTGPVSRVFRFALDEPDLTPRMMVEWIARGLATTGGAAPAEMAWHALLGGVVHRLRAERHLLILDCGEASLHGWDTDGDETYRQVLARLRGGRTLVLIGSRSDEAWLGSVVARYALGPLTAQPRSALLSGELEPARIDAAIADETDPLWTVLAERPSTPSPTATPPETPLATPAGTPTVTPSPPAPGTAGRAADGGMRPGRAGAALIAGVLALAVAVGGYLLNTRDNVVRTPLGASPPPVSAPAAASTGVPQPAVTVDPTWASGDIQATGVRIITPAAGDRVDACVEVTGTATGLAPHETIVVAIRRADRYAGDPFFLYRIKGWEEPGTVTEWSVRVPAGSAIWQEFDILALVGDRERVRDAWRPVGIMLSTTEIEGLRLAAELRVKQTSASDGC